MLAGLISGLTALAGRLPMDAVLASGAGLGRVWLRVGGPRTRRVHSQLARAFPERDAAWIDQATEGVFVHLGRGLAELILLRGRHRPALLQRVEVDGLAHLEAARRASATGGVIVLTAHLGNWELAAAKVASLGLPISAVHRGLRSPALDDALQDLRGGTGGDGTDFEQLRMGRAGLGAIRALRRGRAVLVLLDQDAGREEGVFVPFFGRPASTRYGPARLAVQLGAPVLPGFIERERDGRHHRIRIEPALELEQPTDPNDDEEVMRRNVARMTAAIESRVRAQPEQWIWTHRRWRTQPTSPPRAAGPEDG